jgi:hypothetical protein
VKKVLQIDLRLDEDPKLRDNIYHGPRTINPMHEICARFKDAGIDYNFAVFLMGVEERSGTITAQQFSGG